MVKRKSQLSMGVANARKVTDDFVSAWKRAEKGLEPKEPVNRLHFADMATLFQYLSPKRFQLLQCLRRAGPVSIRKLATELHRDYKNVHSDAKDLLYIGLIEETADQRLVVPWDMIVSELPLLASA